MNKPVFENVIGEKINVGNVLDDTLAGGAATHMTATETPPAPNDDDPSRVSALAPGHDPDEGRRSLQAETAGQARDAKATDGHAVAPAWTFDHDLLSDEVQPFVFSNRVETTSTSRSEASELSPMASAPRSDERAASSSSTSLVGDETVVMAAPPPPDGENEQDPPTNINFSGLKEFEENRPTGESLGVLSASDASSIKSYGIIDPTGALGVRRIGATTQWEVYVKDSSKLDYEAFASSNHQFTITLLATDFYDNQGSQTHTITLKDAWESPTNLALSINTIAEHAPTGTQAGAFAGNLSGISREGGPLWWVFNDLLDAQTFKIVNNGTANAYLEVVNPAALNYEDGSLINFTYRVNMKARSMNGASWTDATFGLKLQDREENPSNLQVKGYGFFGALQIHEGIPAGTRVADILVNDDFGDLPHLQYTITGPGAEYFVIDYSTPVRGIKIKQGAPVIDLETLKNISLHLTVTDPNHGNVSVSDSYTFSIENVNETPTITVLGDPVSHASTYDDIVNPFTGVILADPDDLDYPTPSLLTLKISFAGLRGDLIGAGDPSVEPATGVKTYTLQGTASYLEGILHQVGFNPANGSGATTNFTLTLTDSGNETATNTQVHVVAVDDLPPELQVLHPTVYASDDGPAVNAFAEVRVIDREGGQLTLTISFLEAQGKLGNTGDVEGELSTDGLTRTFTFHGTAGELQTLLAQLTWNQEDGEMDATHFHITLSDDYATVTHDGLQVVVNAPPTITIDPETRVTRAVDNGPAVNPFKGVEFSDREGDELTVTISFMDDHGTLTGPNLGSSVLNGIRTYTLQGSAAYLNSVMDQLAFDPRNGVANTTYFYIGVTDLKHRPVGTNSIAVITSTGNSDTNKAPTITVAQGSDVTTTKDAQAPVSPFTGVTLYDAEDDSLTVTVSFDDADGSLSDAPGAGVVVNGVITYTITGKASVVQGILHGLKFNPHDGVARTTTFTITAKDADHQPVVNTQIKVVNEPASGGLNAAPVLNVIDGTEITHTDDNDTPVNPFSGVELLDADGDYLELWISFADSHGLLGNINGSFQTTLVGDVITYYFTGYAQDLQNLVRALTFNPHNGFANTTNFTIAVKDWAHQAISNSEITVITEVDNGGGGGTNTPPVITVAADTAVTQATDNGPAVFAFRGVDLYDADGDTLTLTISFRDDLGSLGNAEAGTSTVVNGIRTFTFTGKADRLDAILHSLTFDPAEDSADPDGVTTSFTMTVKDPKNQAVGNNQIKVITTHGDGSNSAPWIQVATNSETTLATDTGAPVSPFTGVDLGDDEDDVLTMTVSFRAVDGQLLNTNAATGISELNGVRTYTFTGKAGALETILHGLTFNPKDGLANTTQFTIGLQDAESAVTNSQIKVITEIAGGPNGNTAPTITVADNTKVTDVKDKQLALPFRGVDLFDANDDILTVTISFLELNGTLEFQAVAGVEVIDSGVVDGVQTWTLIGKQAPLDAALQQKVFFNPSDGVVRETKFTIAVKDDSHQPVKNEEIIVRASVDGAPNAPTWNTGGTSVQVDENTITFPYFIKAQDPEGQAVKYSFVPEAGNDNSLFVIDQDTGAITLAPDAHLDYETAQALNIYVRATDPTGLQGPVQKLTINLRDANDVPTGIQFKDAPAKIVISAVPGSLIVRAAAVDPDQNSGNPNFLENRYKFSNGLLVSGKFRIDEISGHITVNEALSPNEFGPQSLEVITYDEDHPNDFVTATYQFTVEGAPYLWVGDPETDVLDTGIASPFTNVAIFDGGRSGVYLKITFDPNEGAFDLSEIPWWYEDFIDATTPGVLKLMGSMQDTIAALPYVKFNPKDRPDGEVGDSEPISFHLALVEDATETELATNDSIVVNSLVENRAPTIIGADADLTIADNENVNLVTPFIGITFNDTNANDDITVTITANSQHGGAFIKADGSEVSGSITLTGSVADVLAAVRALKFNPADRDGAARDATDPITFSISVHDEAGASVSLTPNITVTSVVANRAPDSIILEITGSTSITLNDDIGVNQSISTLSARDLNGDAIEAYRLDEPTDKFLLKNENGTWSLYVNDALEFNEAPHTDGTLRWYEVKVSAWDGRIWSASQTLKIFMNDVDNIAPVIVIDPNGKTEWPADDTDTVAPFQDLTFVDADDASITVSVSMNYANQGAFVLPDEAGFTDIQIFKDNLEGGTIVLIGHQDRVTAYVKLLAFNPANNLGQAGAVVPVGFVVTAFDENTYAIQDVTVETTVTGNPVDNMAPVLWIAPATKTTDATVDGASVYLFRGVDLSDKENDDLTLTITFAAGKGQLKGTTVQGELSSDGLTITYRFPNLKADALDVLLRQLSFDPEVAGDTTFTISVDDGRHPPVSDTVKVHTTANPEPASTTPTIAVGDDTTDAVDNGANVMPFLTVDLSDEDGDILTLTISFTDSHGKLEGTNGYLGSVSGGIRTFIFTGNADQLDALLRGLAFNPADNLAVNGPVTTTFTLSVQDSRHPAVSDEVTVTTSRNNPTPGNAPVDIVLEPNFVDENLANREIGVLKTYDPDAGDTFTYKIVRPDGSEGDSDDRFVLGMSGNNVVLKTLGELDWESGDLKTDYYGKYYEVKVKVTDHTLRSLTETLKVYVQDVKDDPSKASPSIEAAGVQVAVEDDKVVTPFALAFGNVIFRDPDSTDITVTIALDSPSEGWFELNNLGGTYDALAGVYTISGSVADVTAAVQNLKFHAASRPHDPVGSQVITNFAITVSDNNSSARNTTISVVSTAVDGGDEAPTIGGLGTVDADANVGTVAPFGSVTIDNDDGQTTTATIKFLDILGALTGTGLVRGSVDANGIVTYTVTGTNAADLQTKLRALSFDPRSLNAGQSEDIAFNVTLTDSAHPTDGLGQSGTATVHSEADALGPLPDLLENKTVLEHSGFGVSVGRLMSVDADTGETFTYQLTDDAGGRFFLDGNVLRVANSLLLDFEPQRQWSVKFTVTSSLRGELHNQEFTISLRNADVEIIDGGDDGDMFVSTGGDDGLFGHGGDDVLVTGDGLDELWGGAGADAFVIDVYADDGSSLDMIMDFDAEDRIELDAYYFFTLGLGALDPNAFHILGSGTQTDQHQILYDDTTGELFYDMDGSNTEANPILIAMLQDGSGGVPVLTAGKFLIVNNYWTA
jgi:hypothetical protein